MLKRILLWVATVLWLLVIFSFSAQNATNSAELSHQITEKIVKSTTGVQQTPENEIETVVKNAHAGIRKLAHFFLYLVLGVLSVNLCLCYIGSFWRASAIAFCGSSLYALSDEVHQFFVPGRSFLVTDILLDSISVLLGVFLVCLWCFGLKKLKKN